MRALLLIACVLLCHPIHAATFPRTYDKPIRQAAETWLPGIPWKLLKAQLYQESRLDPKARSPVGAEGIAQMMPSTWAEVSRALGYRAIPRSVAEPAILGAAYYMAQVKRLFPGVPELDQHKFGAASYNAGGGHILKAARLCGDSPSWAVVEPCLPQVTGRFSVETTTYVRRIWTYWAMMEAAR